MNRLFLCASALALFTGIAHAEEPILRSGTYILAGATTLANGSTGKAISEGGVLGAIGITGRTSARQVGVPSWELSYFNTSGNGNTLSATGISYIERARNRTNSRGYYGFGLGVYSINLDVDKTVTSGFASAATSRVTTTTSTSTSGAVALGTNDLKGVHVAPTLLVGLPMGSRFFLEARYTALGALKSVRVDQYSASIGMRF
jgi:hypothetical protein